MLRESLLLFLVLGSQLTYVYNFTESNGFVYFQGQIIWNMTWVGTSFNASGLEKFVYFNGTSLKHYNFTLTYNTTSDWYTLTTVFFPYFVVTGTEYTYYNSSIPAIELYSGKNYVIISAQYGVPLAGKWSGFKGQFNTTINFTLTRNPFQFYEGKYQVYTLSNVTQGVNLQVLSPQLVNVSKATYTIYSPALNKTITYKGLSFVGKGFLTVVIPRTAVNTLAGLSALIYNGTMYYVSLSQYNVGYANMSNPFFVAILGNDVYMFFPYGGNATLIFGNPNLNLTVTGWGGSGNASGSNLSGLISSSYLAIGIIVAVVVALAVGTALVRRGR